MNPRSVWKVWVAALALGILGLLVVYGSALEFSNDLRFIYALGAVVLFSFALWLGRSRAAWFAAILLIAPVVAIFWNEVLLKIPALWPNVALWMVAVTAGLLFARTSRNQRGVVVLLIVALLIGSTWYCAGTRQSNWQTPLRV